uniref:Uncharacterized protein n=1 Tax=viral metagenome TaxID=1070528 RepID=A0A2V0RC03_9ZZZZ
MQNTQIHQIGDTLRTKTGNMLHSLYFGQLFNRKVSVPVRVSTTQFLLDFRTTLQEIYEDKESMSQGLVDTILGLLIKTNQTLGTDEIIKKLEAADVIPQSIIGENGEIKEDGRERLSKMVTQLESKIATHTVQSGLSNIIVSDVLSYKDNQTFDLSSLQNVGMEEVSNVVHWAQVFWNQFISQAGGDVLATDLAAKARGSELLKGCRNMYYLFRSGTGAHVEARESYVFDKIFEAIHGEDEKLVEWDPIMKNKIYEVGKSQMPDIGFADTISAFMWSCSTIMGLSPTLENGSESLAGMVDQQVLGIDSQKFYVPTEAGIMDPERVKKHYKLTYLLHLIKRFIADDPGQFMATVNNSIAGNRFFDAKGMEQIFNEELYCLSIAFEAFKDTAYFYRKLYKSDAVLFEDWADVPPQHKSLVIKHVEDGMFDNAKQFMKASDHPAYWTQKAHLFTQEGTDLNVGPLFAEPFISQTAWADMPWERVVSSDKSSSMLRRIAGRPVLNGSWWDMSDAKLPFDRDTIAHRSLVSPKFTFQIRAAESIMSNDIVKAKYTCYPKDQMIRELSRMEDTGFTLMIKKMGEERYFTSAAELSNALRIPVNIASAIWDSTPLAGWATEEQPGKEFWDLSALEGIMFVMKPSAAKYYEYSELESSTNAFNLLPFVAEYPCVIEQHDNMFRTIDPLPLTEDGITFTPVGSPGNNHKPETFTDAQIQQSTVAKAKTAGAKPGLTDTKGKVKTPPTANPITGEQSDDGSESIDSGSKPKKG